MSQHIAEVVKFTLKEHDNADTLSIAMVRGWQCVVKTEDFKDATLGIYIPIDMVVPDTEAWDFMGSSRRVKTRKFRGAISQGLLIPARAKDKEGDDVTSELGIKRYIPKMPGNSLLKSRLGSIPDPVGFDKYTDIEHWKNYTRVFKVGETIAITEKIHGSNARFGIINGKFFVGSHNTTRRISRYGFWKDVFRLMKSYATLGLIKFPDLSARDDETDIWRKIAKDYDIEAKIRGEFAKSDDIILYGEIYGPHIQKLDYGVQQGETHIRFFDIKINGRYCPWQVVKIHLAMMGLPVVPELAITHYGENVFQYIDGKAFAGNHIREGVVIRPYFSEEHDNYLGRKILKMVSEKYLMKDYDEYTDDDDEDVESA